MMEELGIIPTFSIGKRPAVSVTQRLLHRHYSNGAIKPSPKNVDKPIWITNHSNLNDLDEYAEDIDMIYDTLLEFGINTPYLLNSDKITKKIQRIGESKISAKGRIKHIERMADKIVLNLIRGCERLDYLHPKLENKDIQTRYKTLDSLPKLLKELKTNPTKRKSQTTIISHKRLKQCLKKTVN